MAAATNSSAPRTAAARTRDLRVPDDRRRRRNAELMAIPDGKRALYEAVNERLQRLWETAEYSKKRHRGQRTAVQPDKIVLRSRFICGFDGSDTAAATTPIAPTLVSNGRGLALRLALLLAFDAQCRTPPGQQSTNVRTVTPTPDEPYAAWSNLIVSHADVSPITGRGGPQLRRRQVTEALKVLADRRLIDLPAPTRHRGRSRYDGFRLLDDSGQLAHARYTVPEPTQGPGLRREFFTNGWIWALTDAEIAVYLMLAHLRWSYPERHEATGVFVTVADRTHEHGYGIRKATYRSHDMLHRFRLIDRLPAEGRDFGTGKVRDFDKSWETGTVQPHRFRLTDAGLQRPAFETIEQVLNEPNIGDLARMVNF